MYVGEIITLNNCIDQKSTSIKELPITEANIKE